MSEDLIRYDILTQNALRAMIAKLLDEVARTGLPGDHHFFITFDTHAPGVQLSTRMAAKYPDEMTIVIQHRFWELEVGEDGFTIGLSFDEIAEQLVIPFAAIKGFYDPSVKFGLQFEVQTGDDIAANLATQEPPKLVKKSKNQSPANKAKKKKGKSGKSKVSDEMFEGSLKKEPTTEISDETPSGKDDDNSTGGADVVSLDSFRKKK